MKLFLVQCKGNLPTGSDATEGPSLDRVVSAADHDDALAAWATALIDAFFKAVKYRGPATPGVIDAAMVKMVGGQTVDVSEVQLDMDKLGTEHIHEWGDTMSKIVPTTVDGVRGGLN